MIYRSEPIPVNPVNPVFLLILWLETRITNRLISSMAGETAHNSSQVSREVNAFLCIV